MGDNEWMLPLTDIPPKVRYFSASVPTAAKRCYGFIVPWSGTVILEPGISWAAAEVSGQSVPFLLDHHLKLNMPFPANSAKHRQPSRDLCMDHLHMLKCLYPRLPLWAISRGITRAC